MTSYQLQSSEPPTSLTARDVLQLLWRRSGVILLCLGVTAALTYVISKRTPPAWNATAQMIVVDRPSGGVGSPSASAVSPPPETVDTQITMLQTQAMLDRTVKYLEEQGTDAKGRQLIDPIDHKPYWPVQITASRIIKLRKLPTADEIANGLSVTNPRNTNIIDVSVEAEPDKDSGADIASKKERTEALTQAVCLAFVKWKEEIVQANYDGALLSLQNKAKASAAKFQAWQQKHIKFKRDRGLWDVPGQVATAIREFSEISTQIKSAQNDLKVLQTRVGNLRAAVAFQDDLLRQGLPVPNDMQLLQDQMEIAKLENDRRVLAQKITPYVPGGLNDLDAQIKDAKEIYRQHRAVALADKRPSPVKKSEMLGVIQTLDTDIAAQQTKLATLIAQRDERRQALSNANKTLSAYDALQEEGKDIRGVDESLQTALNSVTILQGEASSNILVSQSAYAPDEPSRPNWLRNSLFGGVVGLLLSFMAVALLEQNDQRLRTMSQIRTLMPGPIIGMLPKLNAKRMEALLQGDSLDYEAYSLARANLGLALRAAAPESSEGGQVVLVTSSVPGEGKTVTAVSLARSAARAGKRTILVNADLRHPTLNDVFNTAEPHGLADVVNGKMTLDEALVRSDTPYLDILHGGTPDRNPSDLISQPQMADLIGSLRSEADLIIIDTPPCSVVADALILSPFADCILQVVSLGMADQQAVMDTITALRTAEPASMVFFVNRTPAERPKVYGQYYYHANGQNGANGSAKQSTGEAQPMTLPDGTSGELVDGKRKDDHTA
jgi:capsular exopolysaccharide synthesis family protein